MGLLCGFLSIGLVFVYASVDYKTPTETLISEDIQEEYEPEEEDVDEPIINEIPREIDFCGWVSSRLRLRLSGEEIEALEEEWNHWSLAIQKAFTKKGYDGNFDSIVWNSITDKWKSALYILEPTGKNMEKLASDIKDKCIDRWLPEDEYMIRIRE